jgi:hypothetical protein
LHAHHASPLADQCLHLGGHQDLQAGIAASLPGEKIQEIPLGHQGDEVTGGRQAAEISDLEAAFADFDAQGPQLGMRNLQELLQQPQLIQDA